jgi:hypothetical protein
MKAANRRPAKPDRRENDCDCALQSQSHGRWGDFFEVENQPWTQLSPNRNEDCSEALRFLRLRHQDESCRGNG